MNEILLTKIIEIYTWIIASFIMIFIAAIARFYEKKFGVKTFYYFYFVPVLILFVAVFNLDSYNTPVYKLMELIGTVGSFLATYYLYKRMVGVK